MLSLLDTSQVGGYTVDVVTAGDFPGGWSHCGCCHCWILLRWVVTLWLLSLLVTSRVGGHTVDVVTAGDF